MNTKMMSQFEIIDTDMLALKVVVAIGEILPKQVLEEQQEVFNQALKQEHGKALQLVLWVELYLEVQPMQQHVGGNYGF